MSQKLYCYVDETGQDTQGELFIVAIVVTADERDQLARMCEEIERDSRKGRRKWVKTSYARRLNYVRQIIERPILAGKLNFALYRDAQDYATWTIQTIAMALRMDGEAPEATVLIDGLPRSLEQDVGLRLRRLGVHVKKVRGLKDEQDALIRLADAICGLVRAAVRGQPMMQALFEQALCAGVLRDLRDKQKCPHG